MRPIVILFTCILLAHQLTTSQIPEARQNQLATYGTSTVFYNADCARLTFSVTGLGSTIGEAIAQASERTSRIGAKLQSLGLHQQQMTTSHFNSVDNPQGKSWWSSTSDFAAQYMVTITVDSFALIQPIIEALAGEPVESIGKLIFSLKDDTEKQLASRKAAAENARNKANLIAQTLGTTITRVLYVEDQSPGGDLTNESVAASAAGPYVFSGKQFPITSRLRVVFELGEGK
jgi:uncharacterized protein YggE